MEYLPLIWYYIPEHVVISMICMNKWFLVFKSWRIKTNTVLLLPPWLGKTIRNVWLTHDIGYVTFVVINIPSLPHSCFQRIFITSNTVGAINGTGIAYPSRSSEFVQVLMDSCCSIFFFYYYIYITPVNNLPLGARKPQRFTNIYNEQYN